MFWACSERVLVTSFEKFTITNALLISNRQEKNTPFGLEL